MKTIGFIVMTIMVIAAGKFISARYFQPKDPYPPPPGVEYASVEHLRFIAKEISATLPRDIDSETRLTKVWARESEMVYDLRLINYSSREIDRDKFLPEAQKFIVKAACKEPKMKGFWRNGIMATYQVQGNDGMAVGMVSVGGKDCE